MKKILFINCILLIFGLSVFGQTSNADLKQLQKEIGSPGSISRDDVSIASSKTIKIYLAIKHNKNSAEEFTEWVEKWNRENAAQHGELKIVDKLKDADIAAVQFQYGASRVVREEAIRLKVGKVLGEKEDDRFVLNKIGNSNARAETSARSLQLPLYSYLVVRGANSLWAVDYSRVDEKLNRGVFPEILLQTAVERRLQNR